MDCFTEPIKGAASKLGEMGVESIVKQFKYLIQHKKIIANMNGELDKLKALKQTLQGWVDTESGKGNDIPPNVQQWLSSVTSIENELQNEDEVKKNKKCFGGQCPNLVGNYSLGKQATEKIEEITSLKGEVSKLQLISYLKALPALGSTFTEDIKSLESRNKIIAEVIEKLKDDKFKRISICGMGGVGKTTLVKELIKTTENKLFNKVVMVAVSQNPDYEMIQRQIADLLGLELKMQSMEGRGRKIVEKLKEMDDKKVKVLIVLDDVWQELNFELIGLPSRDRQKDLKILFTSRYEKVCQNMLSQANFHVSVLSKDEAWLLFREMAGDVVDKLDIKSIAIRVAEECGGLPLAIVTFGRALSNEGKSTWEDALRQLSNSQSSSLSKMQDCVYSSIQLSFNFLRSEEHTSCLFLCGLFPKDFDIPIESLLRHGLGLGLFKADDQILKARNRVNYLVNSLKSCFLLLDSKRPGCVKMHDVVRDVVLKISYEAEHGIFVQSDAELKRLKKKQGKWRRVSLILNGKIELENGLECPSLELLQVQSQSKKEDLISWLENFICKMSKLTVLVMQNSCIPKASSLLHALVNLHTLQLEGCDVGDISVIGKKLEKLEILSFAYSNIEELPVEIGQLGLLRLLDLTDCDNLNIISANVLARLSRLEELYFRVNFFPWLRNKDALKELKNLSQKLKVLEIQVWGVDILPNVLIFENLEKFWVYVVPYASYERHGYLESNIIQLRAVDFNSIKSNLMTMLLVKKCEILILEKVKNLKNVIYELDGSGLQYVKDLRLDSCPNLECVIDCCASCCAFPLIKSMSLKNLTKLKEILHASDHHEIEKSVVRFSDLEKLELESLPNLIGFSNAVDLNEPHPPIHHGSSSAPKSIDSTNNEVGEIFSSSHSEPVGRKPSPISAKLFSSNWMKQFPKLETILLRECNSLEMVFHLEGYSESSGHALDLLFPQLRNIKISRLKNLSYVWGNVPQCVRGFQNVRFLTISECGSLKYVFTSAIVREMKNLEELEISTCESIENLVVWSREDEWDDNKGHKKNIGFNKLHYLSLSNLPKLVSICSDSLELECPWKFEISNCPMLGISLLRTHMDAKDECVGEQYLRCLPNLKAVNLSSRYFHLPSLQNVEIEDCPNKLAFSRGFFVAPELKDVTIENKTLMSHYTQKNDMNAIFIQGFKEFDECVGGQYHPFTYSFPNLISLVIEVCNNISILFSHSCLNSLEHLEKLEVQHCENMQAIISQEEIEASANKIMLPKLQHLLLRALPNLKAVNLSSCNFHLPSLQKVEIEDCPNMLAFSRGFFVAPKLEDVTIENKSLMSHYTQKNDMNAIIQGFKEFVASQGSEKLNWTKLHKKTYFINNSRTDIKAFSKLSVLIPLKEIQNLQEYVRELNVRNCDSLVELFESEEGEGTNKGDAATSYQPQPQVISHIWKLTSLSIEHCHNLKSLLSHSLAKSIGQLQVLLVRNCNMMEEIVTKGTERYSKVRILFPELRSLTLTDLPELKCVCSGDYSYDLSLSHVGEDKEKNNNNNKVQILFPKLQDLHLKELPKLKYFCSGACKYDIMVSSIEECPKNTTFPRGYVIVSTPNLRGTWWDDTYVNTYEDLNLTIDYIQNPEKYKMELQKFETFRDIERDERLLGYIKTITKLDLENCHKLLNCAPSNMMHLFSHVKYLTVQGCERLKEIFESKESERQILGFQNLQRLTIKQCHDLKYVFPNVPMAISLPCLIELEVYECNKLVEIIGNNHGQILGFQNLQRLTIKQCHNLKYVFPNVPMAISLPCLIELEVYECNKLVEIIENNHGQILGFQNLQRLTIKQCHNLKYVFPNVPMAICLPCLIELEVYECNKLVEIIGNNYYPSYVQEQQQAKIKVFASLTKIELRKLPSLECFCRSSFPCYVELPECYRIHIEYCPEMKTFWYNGTLYTPRLMDLSVENTKFDGDEEVNEVIKSVFSKASHLALE